MRVAALITNLAMANALFAVNPGAKETTADTKPTEQHEAAIDKPRSAKQTLDSTRFNTVLEKYLKQGRIGYEEFKADKDAVAQLQAYVDAIARMPEAEPLASWITAYNAILIHAILERFPLESVKNAEGGDFRFFREIRYIGSGKERSLADIEHGKPAPQRSCLSAHGVVSAAALGVRRRSAQVSERGYWNEAQLSMGGTVS